MICYVTFHYFLTYKNVIKLHKKFTKMTFKFSLKVFFFPAKRLFHQIGI